VHSALPAGVRLIAILRNPIERAYSSYLFHTRDGRERRTLECAIEEERAAVQRENLGFGQLHYVRLGCYYELLEPYLELFPRRHVAVHLLEDLQQDPTALMRRIFRLLEVDERYRPDVSRRYNVAGIQKSAFLRLLLRDRPLASCAKRMLPERFQHELNGLLEFMRTRRLEKPEMRAETRIWLADNYRADIEKLEKLIGQDLAAWIA
jgi:hypothetical protein